MKKFFALLIAAAMLCCMVVVPAAADGVVTFTAGTVNDAHPGDTVTVPVTISATGAYEAHTLTMHIQYDASKLTVQAITNGEVWSSLADDAMKTKDFTSNPGDIAIGIICPTEGMTATGVFFNIVFVVSEDCTEDQPIVVTNIELYNYPQGGTATPIATAAVNGSVNMAASEPEPTDPPVDPEPTNPPTPPTPGNMSAAFAVTPRTVVEDGDTISIALTVSGSYVAHTMNVAVDYNPAALQLMDVQPGAALNNAPEDAAIIVDAESVPGSVRLGLLAPTQGFSATGTLLVLTFQVKTGFSANYPDGTPVTVAVTEFDNMPEGAATGTAIPCTVAPGIVVPKNGGDTPGPGPGPNPPVTGAMSLLGLGIMAIAAGAGVVTFRKKED